MGKCCLRTLISIVIVIILIIVAITALLNMTPTKLGIADTKLIGEKTLRDFGLADTSLIDIIKSIRQFTTPDEAAIVTNGYSEAEDAPHAESNLSNSNIPTDTDGNPDYLSITENPVMYDNEYLLNYDDTTIAYIFHSMIASASEQAEQEDEDSVEFLKEIGADIREVTITKNGDTASLRIVIKISLASVKTQVQNALGSAASYLSIPDAVFIVSYSEMTVDSNGLIVTTGDSIKINDVDNAISDAIFNVLAAEAENQGADSDTAIVNNKMGEAFAVVIKHLGKVGTADVDINNIVIADTKVLGTAGLLDHKLTLITNTAENYVE